MPPALQHTVNTKRVIFFNCTNIDRKTKMSGIPRVTIQHLKYGIKYAKSEGLTVLPVTIDESGIFDIRNKLPLRGKRSHIASFQAWKRISIPALKQKVWRYTKATVVLFAMAPFVLSASVIPGLIRGKVWRKNLWKRYKVVRKKFIESRALGALKVEAGDIIFMPCWWMDQSPEIFNSLRAQGAIIVPLVHDMLPLSMPDYYDRSGQELFSKNVLPILSSCQHAVYVSEATKRETEYFLQSTRSKPSSTLLCYHGCDVGAHYTEENVGHIRSLFLRSQFNIVMVGTVEPKKNYIYALLELAALWEKGLKFNLFIIGQRGWLSDQTVAEIETHTEYRKQLFWLGEVRDEELDFVYKHSQLYVSCSLAEGFGLPVVEALVNGLPVLLNDISVFREIAGSHANYFNAGETGALSKAVERLIADVASYDSLKSRIASYSWVSWEQSTRTLFDFLKSITLSNATI
jgi:glycosyltransferase involved in cell wall biosynthesis